MTKIYRDSREKMPKIQIVSESEDEARQWSWWFLNRGAMDIRFVPEPEMIGENWVVEFQTTKANLVKAFACKAEMDADNYPTRVERHLVKAAKGIRAVRQKVKEMNKSFLEKGREMFEALPRMECEYFDQSEGLPTYSIGTID